MPFCAINTPAGCQNLPNYRWCWNLFHADDDFLVVVLIQDRKAYAFLATLSSVIVYIIFRVIGWFKEEQFGHNGSKKEVCWSNCSADNETRTKLENHFIFALWSTWSTSGKGRFNQFHQGSYGCAPCILTYVQSDSRVPATFLTIVRIGKIFRT